MWATCYCICTVGYYKPTCSTRDFTNIIRASQLGGWIQCCNTHTIITSPRLVLWLFPHLHETPLLHERSSGTAMVKGGIGPVLTKVERACLWVMAFNYLFRPSPVYDDDDDVTVYQWCSKRRQWQSTDTNVLLVDAVREYDFRPTGPSGRHIAGGYWTPGQPP
jgi:hypothetical protein